MKFVFKKSTLLFIGLFLVCSFIIAKKIIIEKSYADKIVLSINKDFDLGGDTLELPNEGIIEFKGGKIFNGTIIGNNTQIKVMQNKPLFGINLIVGGKWDVETVYDKWFEFDQNPNFVSNRLIKNILALSSEDSFCHIFFDEPRTYYYKLEYTVRPDVWNIVAFKTEEGKRVRNWDDIYTDKFSSLRIFTIPSNTRLTINNTLKMLPTKAGAYFVFWEYDKENITIDGKGAIYGDCKGHEYFYDRNGKFSYSGEWGFLFKCIKCRNFAFRDITLSDAHGDCINYGGSRYELEEGARRASDLTVENVKIMYARRNGISVGVTNAVIQNCSFEGCGIDEIHGTAPRAAIDFEPDLVNKYPEIGNKNVVMRNCTFVNNKHDVSSTRNNIYAFGKQTTFIQNCKFTAPVRLNPTWWITFENCKIPSFTNWKGKITKDTPVMNIVFYNCEIDTLPAVLKMDSWHNSFRDCTIRNITD